MSRAVVYVLATGLFVAIVDARRSWDHRAKPTISSRHPKGWTQPKTPWGDPDIQGMWPISFVGSVPLERCAGGGGRGRGAFSHPATPTRRSSPTPSTRSASTRPRNKSIAMPRPSPQAISARPSSRGSPTLRRLSDRPLNRRSAERKAARDDGRGKAAVCADEEQLGASGRDPGVGFLLGFRQLGPLHHARNALLDDAVSLQQRRAHHAGPGLRDPGPRDGARDAYRPGRRSAGTLFQDQALDG